MPNLPPAPSAVPIGAPTPSPSYEQSQGDFYCNYYKANNTQSTTVNYKTCNAALSMCEGSSFTANTCQYYFFLAGDTNLVVANSSGEVMSITVDSCAVLGFESYPGGQFISFTVPAGAGCDTYTIREGSPNILLLLLSLLLWKSVRMLLLILKITSREGSTSYSLNKMILVIF